MFLGLRPEHTRLDPAGVAAEVVVIEPTGSETQVILRLGGVDLVGLFRERIAAGPGQSIKITPGGGPGPSVRQPDRSAHRTLTVF